MLLQQVIHTPKSVPVSAEALAQAKTYLASVTAEQPSWKDIAQKTDDLAEIQSIADGFAGKCEHVVLCGTGGSSLGAGALLGLCAHPLGLTTPGRPTIHLLDSTEPELLDAVFALPQEKTGWLFVSRSGGTLETLAQFLAYVSRGAHAKSPVAQVIALPGDNPLRKLAQHYGLPVLDHAQPIGGRFSVLSNVGLLPAAIAGLDIAALRNGAASMLTDEGLGMAIQATAWHAQNHKAGFITHGMLPYTARLKGWTYWYRQLWAESLGKEGKGTTPLIGIGPLDQHSMLQLLLDGPQDKSMTTIHVAPEAAAGANGATLGAGIALSDPSLAFISELQGETIMHAQAYGTTHSFINRQIPTRELRLPDVSEKTIGALFMLQMLETVLTAQAFGVNAFDQPAVEESKVLAMGYLRDRKSNLAATA